jgi:hypothetical protein
VVVVVGGELRREAPKKASSLEVSLG